MNSAENTGELDNDSFSSALNVVIRGMFNSIWSGEAVPIPAASVMIKTLQTQLDLLLGLVGISVGIVESPRWVSICDQLKAGIDGLKNHPTYPPPPESFYLLTVAETVDWVAKTRKPMTKSQSGVDSAVLESVASDVKRLLELIASGGSPKVGNERRLMPPDDWVPSWSEATIMLSGGRREQFKRTVGVRPYGEQSPWRLCNAIGYAGKVAENPGKDRRKSFLFLLDQLLLAFDLDLSDVSQLAYEVATELKEPITVDSLNADIRSAIKNAKVAYGCKARPTR